MEKRGKEGRGRGGHLTEERGVYCKPHLVRQRGERGAAWSTEKDYPGLSQKSAVYVCTYMDKICIFHLHINACHSLGHFFLSCPENGYGEKERETGRSGGGNRGTRSE